MYILYYQSENSQSKTTMSKRKNKFKFRTLHIIFKEAIRLITNVGILSVSDIAES